MEQPTEEYFKDRTLKEKREIYIRLYKELFLPLIFEEYWSLVFEKRYKESLLTTKEKKQLRKRQEKKNKFNPLAPFDYPFVDIFKTTTDDDEKGNPKQLAAVCLIPMTRYHWDTILFMYHLLFPDKMESTGHVATYILYFLKQNKAKPNEIENYHKKTHSFLKKHSRAEHLDNGTQNWMIVNPVRCYYMMMRGHLLLTYNFSGVETDQELSELLELYTTDLEETHDPKQKEKLEKKIETLKTIITKIKELQEKSITDIQNVISNNKE